MTKLTGEPAVAPVASRDASPQAAPPARRGLLARFLVPSGVHDSAHEGAHEAHAWWKVLWLTGVDYFSTLGYQPGIAFLAAGALSPIATAILVLVTLAGALPVYGQVARRSYAGQGSIAMLERLLPGWKGKILVLTLLGFAATDFVITMTLSAADAAQHAVENPLVHGWIGDHQIVVTGGLLVLLAGVFLVGFREAIGLAMLVGVPYIVLNIVVIAAALVRILEDPAVLAGWREAIFRSHASWTGLLAASVLIFPKLALGMSGFETGVSVMPLVKGDEGEGSPPHGRIRNARKLLAAAALLMSVLLVTSSLVTTCLIPAAAFAEGGKANGRALAYLAHEMFGGGFGTLYDIVTIAILWFAGASAMAGMLNLIPRYLPRFGMAPRWTEHARPLVLILLAIDLLVTVVFKANVDAQGGAYATGVLVLMLSAAVAVALALWREKSAVSSLYFWLVAGVFAFTLADNVLERPDGLIIGSLFILSVIVLSAVSRWLRSTELRVEEIEFADPVSRGLWDSLRGKKVNLIPLRSTTEAARRAKIEKVRRHYRCDGRITFVHVNLADDRSDFHSHLRCRVWQEGEAFVIELDGAVAIANTVAWLSEQLDPIALYLGLSLNNPVSQALQYLLWGEGETGVLVYEILVEYWHSTPEDDVRPFIFLVSE